MPLDLCFGFLSVLCVLLFAGCLSFNGASFIVSATLSPYIVHESRRSPPPGWKAVERAEPTTLLPHVRIALVQSPLATSHLDAFLMDVSDPSSPNYTKYWTREDVREIFRPEPSTVETVKMWLGEHGLDTIQMSHDGGWMTVSGVSVAQAERLFRTEYWIHRIETEEQQTERIACSEYSLPEHIAKAVDFVIPTLHFDARPRKSISRATNVGLGVFKTGLSDTLEPVEVCVHLIGPQMHFII